MNYCEEGRMYNRYELYLMKHKAKQNRGATGKDSEMTKTYRAEWAFQKNFGSGREFGSIQEVQKYVNKITGSKTYGKLFVEANEDNVVGLLAGNKVRVAAKPRSSGRGFAGIASRGHITLDALSGLNEYTVLHELSHCIGHWHHGRSFRRALVKLVSRFMGTGTATLLKEEFKRAKLPYGNAREPMPYENWRASVERMEAMRDRRDWFEAGRRLKAA
jgi:putative metallohydrolase (TIGR04338 family)